MRGAALRRCALAGLLALAPAPDAFAEGTPSREPVELRVLVYNTHGLPGWIAGDDPERRFPEISRRLNAYELALLQEDFYWHAGLASQLRHPLVSRGDPERTSWSRGWWWLDGSGLTIVSALPRAEPAARVDRWLGACAGWLGGAFDCWASKGVLMERVRLANGAELDAWTLHLDAGRDDADRIARRAQLDALVALVREHSAGRALVIGGDFNLRGDDPEDAADLARFVEALGLRDAGALPVGHPSWSRPIDYVLWRAGDGVRVEQLEAGVAAEFEPDGVPLSDHPALFVRLRVDADQTLARWPK